MGFLEFLFKNTESAKLAELLWVEKLEASVNELSHLSGLSYTTTYDELQRMKSLKLVKMKRNGKATYYSSALTDELTAAVKNLFEKVKTGNVKNVSFNEYNLPLLGDYDELLKNDKTSAEELLIKAVKFSKKNATLLRVLPLLVKRMGENLDIHQLEYWSKRYDTHRELGFLLDLTTELTKNKKFSKLARSFKDKRWSKSDYYFEGDRELKGFQAMLVDKNTPDLAKKWYLKLNMGLDSFESFYNKYEKAGA